MNPQQAGDSGVPNIEQLQNVAMNVVENFCGIVAMPVEIIIRPHYGTRYYPVPVTFFSCVMMILLPLFSAMATGIVNMIPFSHARAPIGLFSIGSLSQLFFLLLFIHGIRLSQAPAPHPATRLTTRSTTRSTTRLTWVNRSRGTVPRR